VILTDDNEFRNWDQQSNTALYSASGSIIGDALQDKYPNAGRTGIIIPTGGRGIADEGFNRSLTKKPISGLREVSNASPGDLASGEWAFDDNRSGTGSSAWLFKDSEGALHYLDFDGTV